jgi:hypothetical protein
MQIFAVAAFSFHSVGFLTYIAIGSKLMAMRLKVQGIKIRSVTLMYIIAKLPNCAPLSLRMSHSIEQKKAE